VAVRDERSGQFCAAIAVISDLVGFGYSSEIGVVRVDFSRPGKDLVFLLPNERILEIYHPDFQPLKIILSELGIQLQPKQVWLIKLTGEKKITEGIPILIETNTDSVAITLNGKSYGINNALMVRAGKHEIQLSKPDYETITDTIIVDEKNRQFKYTMLIATVMVFVKCGTFQMGDTFGDGEDDEKPVHQVTLSDFYIGKYEVTNGQFCKFLNEKGNQEEGGELWLDLKSPYSYCKKRDEKYAPKSGYENHPVADVTWYGAKAYCEWAGGRLPTEAEWEYAAKGGNKSRGYKYSGSNNINAVAWYYNKSGDRTVLLDREFIATPVWHPYDFVRTQPVGIKEPNELGIYDMSGNVLEWCWDWYDENYYSNSPASNPKGPVSGILRVMRGGSWNYYASDCGSAHRFATSPRTSDYHCGFRVVRGSPQKK